ncbi:MAG: tandem-95 repeat protein [Bacteroidales bacterium]|nr:tandem-95 repeat protein [Bacteroidales bacterium]
MRTFPRINKLAVLLTAFGLFLLPVYMNGQFAPEISDIPDQTVEEGTAFAEIMLNDLVSDEDTPDDMLNWEVSDEFTEIKVHLTESTAVVIVPDENWYGSELITFTVSDGTFSDSDEATFMVTPVNDLPVLADIPNFTIEKGETFAPVPLDDYVTDVDNSKSELTWEYDGNEELSVDIDEVHYAYVEVPENWIGNEAITFSVSDGQAEVGDLSVFTVKEPEPVAIDDHYVVDEGATLSTPASGVLSNDFNADDESTTAIAVTGPVNGSTFNLNGDGSFVYTHNGSETTSDGFTYLIDDGAVESNVANVTIEVNPVNDAPVITGLTGQTINEGEAFADLPLNNFVSDAETSNDLLAWSVTGQDNLDVRIDEASHIASISATSSDWNGTETITFTVSDPELSTASEAATFVINAIYEAPVAVNDAYDIAEGTTLAVSAPGVLSNDTGGDGNSLLAVLENSPAHSTSFSLEPSGAFTYTHDGSETTSDAFTYLIDDGVAESNVANVTIEVHPVNDAPVITGLTGQVIQEGDDFADIDLNQLVDDAEDADYLLAWTATGQNRLDVNINEDSHIATITPPSKHWNGSEIITFTVTDTEDLSDSESATFEVTALAETPVANDDSYTVAEGGTLTVSAPGILTNDTDGDGDPLLAMLETNPSFHSSFTLNTNGSFTYVNNGEENTSDSFTYKASDGTAQSDPATVAITITSINDAPVLSEFSASEYTFNEDGPAIQILSGLVVNDPDNLTLQYATVGITGGLQSSADVLSVTLGSGITGSYNSSTGILTLNGPATPAAFQTVMQTITFGNSSQDPTTTDRTIETRVYDGTEFSNTLSKTVHVSAQNDPPVVADIPNQTVAEGSTFTTINLDSYVTDPDHTISELDLDSYGNSSLTVSISGSVATITIPNADWNGSETITFEATDPIGGYDSDPAIFTVTAVNDVPVLSNMESSNLEYAEGAGAVQITNTITTSDVDNPNLASARVWISAGYTDGQDVLSCSNTNGLTGAWNPGSGEYTLTGSGTLANYQNALRNIRYNNTSSNPSAVTRTISFRVNDGELNSELVSRNIIVTGENNPPTLAETSSSTINYTENATPVTLTSTITVTDSDNLTLNGATISITTGFLSGEDFLSFTEANGISGSYTPATGVLALTGSASLANYQAALRTVRYNNTSDNPTIANRSVTFTVTDGTNTSNSIVKTVSLTAVNDAPVLADDATAPVNYTENSPSVQLTNTITVADPDNTSLTGATISITSGFQTTEDVLSFTSANGITGVYNSTSGILTLSGTTTLANYRTALRSVRYVNTSEGPTTTSRVISFRVTDGETVNQLSNIITKTVTITAINDAPVATDVIITAANDRIGTLNTGSFTFTDPDGDDPGIHIYKWYRSDYPNGSPATVIAGATTATYRAVKADGGKYIGFEVTPVDENTLAGLPSRSDFRYINANPVASNATIYAPLTQPGAIIRGRFTYSDKENNLRGNSIFYWYRSNTSAPTPAAPGTLLTPGGTTDSTYRLVAADANKWIWYRVYPVAQSGSTPGDSVWSNIIGPIGSYSANITGSDTACHGAIMPITLTINAGQSPYTAILRRTNSSANKDTTISGIVASPRIINVKIPGTYTLLSLADAGSDLADVSASQPVVLVINPKARALLGGRYEICDDGVSKASLSMNFVAGVSPWSVKLRRGNSASYDTTFTNITDDPFPFNARVIGTTATRYRIIEIRDANNCPGDTTSGSAWVSYKPSPSATISGLDSICPGEPATLTIALSPTSTPNWSFTYLKDGATPTTIGNLSSYTYDLEVTSPGIYTLAAVTDQSCTGKVSGTGTIRSHEIPTATISGTQTICQHTSGNLSVALTGHAPWSYKFRLVGVDTTQRIGITSSPNTISVNKAGTYNLLEVYDKNCKGTVAGNAIITITAAPDVELTGLAPAYDKLDSRLIPLTGTPTGTPGNSQFSGPGLILNDGKYSFFPPLAPVGTNNIVYAYRANSSSCWGYDTSVVRILEANSIIEFEDDRTKYCTNDQPFTITGTNILGEPGEFSISGGVGLIDHGDNTATINPALLNPNNYTITYTYYDAGLPQPEQANFDVGVSPVADFKGATECFQLGQSVTLNNTSVSNFGFLSDTLFFWKILNKTGSGYLVNDTARDISYAFAEPGNYNVSLELYNSNGCYTSTTKTFALRPTLVPAEETQFEEFETGAPGWTKDSSSDSPNSWMLGDPSKGFTGPYSGANCWFTLTQGTRPPREQSWVLTPCYDFRGTEKPMLKMRVWRLFNSNRDGANVQFSADSGKTWTPLGDLNDGISWYNYTYIPGLIGDNKIGWCVHPVTNLGNDTEWKEVRHSLDILKDKPQVQFRIAYGSDGSAQNNNGIAFDNFWIGERKRTALIEHFTNSSDAACIEADSLLDAFTENNELSVINIQYHTSNPPGDPFYEDNPVIPSTREFYYGVSDVPYALLNGGVTSQHSFDYIESSKPFNKNVAIIESLRDANFDISINSGIKNGNTLIVEVDIVAVNAMPMTELSLRVAVIEREIHGISGNNGDTVFRNVVKAMLPGAAGISIPKSWSVSDHEKRYLEWPLQNIYDILQLRLVAFLQDGTTYEVYQAKLDTIDNAVGIFEPRPEKPLKKNFIVYPNPASQSAFVRFDNELTSGTLINLYNNTGSLVYSNQLEAGSNMAEIPVADLPDGIYMIRMTVKNQLLGISKLIISR